MSGRAALRAGCVALALLAPAAAGAAVHVRTDTENRVRFRLDGRFVTVRPLLNDRALWRERVGAECGTGRSGRSHVVVHAVRTWPRGARKLTFRLPRDISRRARSCRFESAPTHVVIASVTFGRGSSVRSRIRSSSLGP